jgi:hemolysin activation/secretion protein
MTFSRSAAPSWLCALAALLLALPCSAQTRFDIQRFVVQGNTLLPQAEVQRLVAPFEGRSRDFGDVQRALEALQDAYVERGYSAVRVSVPEQDLVGGEVRIQVTEARIAAVRVEGNTFFDTPNVRAAIPSLREGASPNTEAISQSVVLANENPARQMGVSLEPGQEPTQVNAVLKVTDSSPSRWSVSLDNTGSSATGYFRTGVGYQHANLFNRDHVFNMQYITSPDHIGDVTIFGLGYRVPFYEQKGFFDVFGGHSDVNSGTVQNLFTVSGSGTILGARYTQVLPKIDSYDLSFYGTFVTNTPGGSDGNQDAFTAQRAGANARYQIWRYGAALSHALPQDYLIRAAFSGQHTRDLLIPGEQFGMGGADSVRGYLEREVASDIGQRLSFELYSPDFGGRLGDGWRTRALAFYDVARGHDRIPARVATNEINGLSSTGVGLRFTRGRAFSARLDYAYALNAAGTRPEGKDRVHFSLVYSF